MINKMNNSKQSSFSLLLPVYFSFIIMGFADIVGIATNYVKLDFGLSNTLANLVPMMVFLWFFVFSIPTGMLMGKIGRKRTVLLSMLITTIAMVIPFFGYSFPIILFTFALLGIGNTILQVSLPVLTNTVATKNFNTKLTLGYFFKSVFAILCPIFILMSINTFGNWQSLFPIFAIGSTAALIWLSLVKVDEVREKQAKTSFMSVFSLLKDKYILNLFIIIVLIVGFEIGFLTTIPKYLMERSGLTLEDGNYANTIYFIAKAAGGFLGAMLMIKMSAKKFLVMSMTLAMAAFIWFMASGGQWNLYLSIFIVGLTLANIVPIVVSKAIEVNPDKGNELTALVMTGICGGAIFPPIMGLVSDLSGSQYICLFIPLLTLIYILYASIFIIKEN
jgi:MFS transporter, FHS family, L-fucose permease